jgi:hypothetical protein
MNTSFGGNQVGSFVTLDVAGSYPLGALSQLGPYYNYSQDEMVAQTRYTATQAELTTQQDADYALKNLALERTGIITPDSIEAKMAATNYVNAASQVNYANQNVSNSANLEYTNADIVAKACCDAAYSAYLMVEASQIILDRISTSASIIPRGATTPNVNQIDYTTLSTISTLVKVIDVHSLSTISLARDNNLSYYNKTYSLLTNAYNKSNMLYRNLKLVSAFNTLVRACVKALADPMSKISGKETLVTQYVPSPPLNNAINVVKSALTSLTAISAAITLNTNSSPSFISTVSTSIMLSNSLDGAARPLDISMYLATAVAKQTVITASTMQEYGQIIAIPNVYPKNATVVSADVISTASLASVIALDADVSAQNGRSVSNALIELRNACSAVPSFDSTIKTVVKNSLLALNTMLATVGTVTSNTSAHTGVKVSIRASNTLLGQLSKCSSDEKIALQKESDAYSVLDLIIRARNTLTLAVNLPTTITAHWAINAAKGRAEEVAIKARHDAYIASSTAHNLVTPARIAVQTYAANRAGLVNIETISRMNRNSINPTKIPPQPYTSFQADIQAKTFIPLRPTLEQLVIRNRLSPLRPDSLRTIEAATKRVTQEVQQIKDASVFSFRQQ